MSLNRQQETSTTHIPVMVEEVLKYLITDIHGIYIDGTVGLGGHATQILNFLSPSGRLLGIDRDEKALEICRKRISDSSVFSSFHASYHQLDKILLQEGITTVNGILLDLGLSSVQLSNPSRGFSFQQSGFLDMRFDLDSGQSAAALIASLRERELADLIYKYGEDRYSRRIAKAIKNMPELKTTDDLNEAVRISTPPQSRQKSLARVYQALRIVVNQELEKLEDFLNLFIDFLAIGGRIVIISYHSLEDRLVKQYFKKLKTENRLNILTKKPLPPSQQECMLNSRSRSAKLRAAERI